MIAHLNSPPNLKAFAEALNARYSESLGVVLVHLRMREVNFLQAEK
jgi:hypothetical protein